VIRAIKIWAGPNASRPRINIRQYADADEIKQELGGPFFRWSMISEISGSEVKGICVCENYNAFYAGCPISIAMVNTKYTPNMLEYSIRGSAAFVNMDADRGITSLSDAQIQYLQSRIDFVDEEDDEVYLSDILNKQDGVFVLRL
jgi:hypothetical protein